LAENAGHENRVIGRKFRHQAGEDQSHWEGIGNAGGEGWGVSEKKGEPIEGKPELLKKKPLRKRHHKRGGEKTSYQGEGLSSA